ncbi:RNA polymerase sigma factor [Candidimonas humi]|uniref:RNA polymerase sigma factor n=1 Tax=Candidimonas humi TaxID=683355 RepID=A0ABV8NUQ8_9BURK|nr:RNA polymerase sigma factor [Candidimonas humi]MBV6304873.1 RNA polymerase sigma factor [Candidimonas humi]
MGTMADAVSIDDAELIQLAASGDIAAFDALMRHHNQRLYRVARSVLHDEADAEEAVQEAWWKAYNHLQDFRAEARPTTWLTRIAINEALMLRRRNQSREAVIQSAYQDQRTQDTMPMDELPLAIPASSQPDQQAWRSELRGLIEQRIDALPDIYRSVFVLRGVEGMSASEVAAALDLPEATIRVRFMRARRLLQDALARDIDQHTKDAFSFAGERCDRIVAAVHARIREQAAKP